MGVSKTAGKTQRTTHKRGTTMTYLRISDVPTGLESLEDLYAWVEDQHTRDEQRQARSRTRRWARQAAQREERGWWN
jgi:hypothetical protein